MNLHTRKIAIAITGASGSIYAKRLINKLIDIGIDNLKIDLVFSKNAVDVWKYELGEDPETTIQLPIFDYSNFFAPFASGSAAYEMLIICPCSMGMLGRIAHGISDDLISRAADVMLKENKKLIIVPRESPLNLIHLKNLTLVKEAGAIIIPASPSFYSRPKSIEELVDTIVDRVLLQAGFSINSYRWGGE